MKRTINIVLSDAERLLGLGRFKEVVSELSKIDDANMRQSEQAMRHLLLAEARIRLGDYDVEGCLESALEYYRNVNDEKKLAAARHLMGCTLLARGMYFDAREFLIEAYVAYKRLEKPAECARVLNRLGFLCYHLGEIDSALDYIKRSTRIYEHLNDTQRVLVVSANLGTIYFSVGRLAESIHVYEQIDASIASWADKRNICAHYCQSALPHALRGDTRKARAAIAKSIKYLPDYPREQAIYYENLGWIHLLAEEYAEAEEALLKGLEISLRIAPESALVSQIKRRLADACFGLGKYDLARQYADEALVVAEKINERVEIAACWRVYAQLDGKDGNQDKARHWYKKACDIFSMIGSRYELAATRYLAALSGAYQNGERQALLYLAREYFQSEEVRPYIDKINAELVRAMPAAARATPPNGQPPVVITVNPAMTRIVELACHIAPSEMSVLLTGPTGAGKDLLALYIHYHSGRAGKFVSINAAAIPDSMIESELFGYKKGAYTGADTATRGLFEDADGGTLYLNEIADASSELQAKLLDVLETKTIRRLGERTERKIDFRLIAATNHHIDQLIREERFRLDLYHRLNEIPLALPALADRLDDIPALVAHFLEREKTACDPDSDQFHQLADRLTHHLWPGNVRQLEAEIKRLVLVSGGEISRMIAAVADDTGLERQQLLTVLEETGWNRREAARRLGISESAVRKRIEKHGLFEFQPR